MSSRKRKKKIEEVKPLNDAFYAKWDAYAARQSALWEMYSGPPISAAAGVKIKIG